MDALSLQLALSFIDRRLAPAEVDEDYLLHVILNPRSKYKVYGAVLALRHLGTRKSIEVLKQCCLCPVVDLQITAVFTLTRVAGSSLADFYEELLVTKAYREKWAAMAALCQYGEAKHLATVLNRVKKRVKRTRACPVYGTPWGKETEVTATLKFLKRHNIFDRTTIRVIETIQKEGIALTNVEQAALGDFLTTRTATLTTYTNRSGNII